MKGKNKPGQSPNYVPPIKIEPEGYLDEEGKPKSLKHLSEGITTLDETFEENNYQIRKAWKSYSPKNAGPDEVGRMAYVPETTMRRSEPKIKNKSGNLPYWILAMNKARDMRPKTEDKDIIVDHCNLCEHILKADMTITKIENYHITPNGFPYFDYAFLGIDGSTPFRAQTDLPRPEEIDTWGKICATFNLAAFFNPPGAGASIYEHQHIQLFDPRVFKLDGRVTPLPLFNPEITEEIPVRGDSSDVFYIKGYPIPTLMFLGYDAPDKVASAAHKAKSLNFAFNIEVLISEDQEKFYFQIRNPMNETSICMRRKCGGLEMMGVALLGDIEEKSGEKNITTDGSKVFTKMSYNTMRKNLINASYPKGYLDPIAKCF